MRLLMELRVLIHAPRGDDAAAIEDVIRPSHDVLVCETSTQLLDAMREGAAAVVLDKKTLAQESLEKGLAAWLAAQPPWSDFPFIVLASPNGEGRSQAAMRVANELGNVILLERPFNAETLLSAADAAVRARRRQYITRRHLEEIRSGQVQVERLNSRLEARIETRTMELSAANNRLMKEIAGRERAQAALAQVQKIEAVGRLTGGIAHDFNNLLHVVNMNLELISLYATEEKVQPVVERAKSAARRGARLTGQLLSFARNQSLLPRLTHVNKLLMGMKDLLEISAGSGVNVELELCEPDLAVVVDPGQLEVAVLNLAANAREAMPDGGALKISTSEHRATDGGGQMRWGDYVAVTVTDSGPGIPAHLLGKVFDPFFTTKPSGSASGLGLSQVYGFARQSGGLAFIRSQPGQGTTVAMYFPVAPAEAHEVAEPQPAPTPAAPAAKAHRILVVEDDADVRRVIVECLGLIGYAVSEAPNGSQGLAAIASDKPDLLVVDYAMPDMTGAEVICKARELVGELPVILATGYADMSAVERLAGKPAILRKPFDMHSLGTAVATALQAA
jgi:signal transduction histidine kinase